MPAPTGLLADEIGVVGHSNVSTFVEAYQIVSSRDLLTLLNQGGADALVWGDPTDPNHDGAWDSLVTGEPVGGYRAIWVMLGFLDNYSQSEAVRQGWGTHVKAQIDSLFPTVEWIWWSPMNTYADPDPGDGDAEDLVGFTLPAPFSGANHTGPQQSIDLMFYAYDQGYADDYGPWINLTDALTDTDNRHPTEPPATEPTGATYGGEILATFFDVSLITAIAGAVRTGTI